MKERSGAGGPETTAAMDALTSPRSGGPRRRSSLLLLAVAAAALLLLHAGMRAGYERAVELATDRNTGALDVAYRSVVNAHRLDAGTRLRHQLLRPEQLAILRQARAAPPDALAGHSRALRDSLRAVAEELRGQEVGHVHFHTPDCVSLLRLHAPEALGDALSELRPGVCRANATLEPVSGFESGRMLAAYRYIHPVIDDGEHLGSVEIALPFARIAVELAALLPADTRFALLLTTDAVPQQGPPREPAAAPFGEGFLAVDSGIDPALLRDLASRVAAMGPVMREGASFSVPLGDDDAAWVATFLAVPDLDGEGHAYILAVAPDVAVPLLWRNALRQGLLVAALILLAAALVYLALRQGTKIRRQFDQLNAIAQSMAEGIYVIDRSGMITMVNDVACQLLGYPQAELVGRQAHALFHSHDGNRNLPQEQCPVFRTAITTEGFVGEESFLTRSGQVLPVQVHSRALRDRGEVVGSVAIFSDISERKAREAEVYQAAFHDSLTRLPNRRLFMETLERAAGELQPPQLLGVLFIDLDEFKPVNDRLGHDAGDRLLQEVAVRMNNCVAAGDMVARTGGDEFVVLLRDLGDAGQARRVGERILAALQAPFQLKQEEVRISACIGVAVYPQHTADLVALLRHADQAMYWAKENGRSQVVVYDPAWGDPAGSGRIMG